MIVGIDLGGTKTRVIAEEGGASLLDVTVPTRSWQSGLLLEDEKNPRRLLSLFDGLAGSGMAAIAIGARDLDNDRQLREFNTRVSQAHGGPVLAVNDVELLAPAAGLENAIAVIVGTGSKVVGHGADGAIVSAGGHGYLLDDEGSAPWLARTAMSRVLDAHDQGRDPDALALSFMDHFGVDDVVDASYAFATTVGLNSWARLCPLVFEAADAGSELAVTVITDAAHYLADDVALVHRRGALGTDVLCAGGVVTNQPRLFQALVRDIDDLALGLAVHLLTVPPVMGALALARKLGQQNHHSDQWRIT